VAAAASCKRPAHPHALTAHPQRSRVPERLHPSHSVSLRPAFALVFSPAASWLPTELASRWLGGERAQWHRVGAGEMLGGAGG
jgi:hypothetical protein